MDISGSPARLPRVLFFYVFILVLTSVSSSVLAYEVLLGTAEVGSFSGFAAKKLCHSISRFADEITCRTKVMNDAADILTNLQNGSLDFALVNSKVIHDAVYKEKVFKYTDINYDNLRLLLPIYRQPVSILVRADSDIYTLDDLKGKKINGGESASMQQRIFQDIMEAKGWNKKSFNLYQNLSSVNSQDFIAFHGGSVQAMIHIGMHPDEKIARELAFSRGRIIAVYDSDIAELVEKNIGFCNCRIGQEVYSGNGQIGRTLAVETLLLTSADVDNEIVAKILESIYTDKESLQNAHPAFLAERFKIEKLNTSYLHPHPQATMFFQENINKL